MEVGTGNGSLSELLCRKGLRGKGYEPSEKAYRISKQRLAPYLESGQYDLVHAPFSASDSPLTKSDLVVSMMVLEHVQDDLTLVKSMVGQTRVGGYVLALVPGGKKYWSEEDDYAGHLRRYEREELKALFENAELSDVQVRSVSVPISNLLRKAGQYLTRRALRGQAGLTVDQRSEISGIQNIPFKTHFPAYFGVLLNAVTMWPFIQIQRFFYPSRFGVTLLAFGKVK